jgi:Xaa-Pro aminopeptidase
MNRIQHFHERLQQEALDYFIVTRLSNIAWLCGYSGSSGFMLISPTEAIFYSDFRYRSQAEEQVHDARIVIYVDDFISELKRSNLRITDKIGFEAPFMDVATYNLLRDVFPNANWVPTNKLVETLASIKEPQEIVKIKKAIAITEAVYNEVIHLIKPGVSELDISAEITYRHKKKGADGDSFPPIVASGMRSALPHGIASNKKIENGEIVTIDMGCFYQGYASDLTRNVFVGKANPQAKKIHALVQLAQETAIDKARDGMRAKELDEVARAVIRDAGSGEYFGHGLGHGLGLEVHTQPRVHFTSDDILSSGQVFTVEPGIYVPDFGGIRIEDDVHLLENCCNVLTSAPKELIEL